jgi:hypothetical protein
LQRTLHLPPHRFQKIHIIGVARKHMPVQVRHWVTETRKTNLLWSHSLAHRLLDLLHQRQDIHYQHSIRQSSARICPVASFVSAAMTHLGMNSNA